MTKSAEIRNLDTARFDRWRDEGRQIVAASHKIGDNTSANQWQIGDWWNAGEPYGERNRVAKELGLNPASCRQLSVVAKAFEVFRRLNTLTFGHHASVSSMDQVEQDRLLNWCQNPDGTRHSVAELRAEISGKKGGGKKGPRAKPATAKIPEARLAIRAIIGTEGTVSQKAEWAAKLGVSVDTIERAEGEELARLEGLCEAQEGAVADRIVLPMTAQQKLDAILKRERANLEAGFAARKAGQDEEVRQRVLKENAEYLAMLKQREAEAWKTEEWYRGLINDHQPPLTEDEFMLLTLCVRGYASDEKRHEAGVILNTKRTILTGKKGK